MSVSRTLRLTSVLFSIVAAVGKIAILAVDLEVRVEVDDGIVARGEPGPLPTT
jgi:hypothetical protein